MNTRSHDHLAHANAAKEILLKDYRKQISTYIIAMEVGVSERQLKRIFKQVFNVGIYAYQLQIRMQKATELLEEDNRTVKEIAILVGYKSASSFIRRFTKYYGVSPACWEKQNAGKSKKILARTVNSLA